MPKEYTRVSRIADLIRRELSVILQSEMTDTRLRFITITSVKVSRDFSFSDILFTQIDVECASDKLQYKKQVLKQLKKAAVRLRYILAQRLSLRTIPALRFFYDDLSADQHRLHALIDVVSTKDQLD